MAGEFVPLPLVLHPRYSSYAGAEAFGTAKKSQVALNLRWLARNVRRLCAGSS